MAVEGLPKTLEILMSSLLQENNVLSWQIYQDKSGNVNMKLRFTGDNVTHDQPPVSYRRIPQRLLYVTSGLRAMANGHGLKCVKCFQFKIK